jgi:uncharacterized repeat protein (TIGR03803 family)
MIGVLAAAPILYSFKGKGDGESPSSTLVRDGHSNLYGTASAGGGSGCGGYGCGTVYKFAPSGKLTVLHAFSGGNDGADPAAGVIDDKHGNVYGTTLDGGGTGCGGNGCGTVFKLDSDGTESVLYSFSGGNDGSQPLAAVMEDRAGNLYGTTSEGGATATAPFSRLRAAASRRYFIPLKVEATEPSPWLD